LEFKMRKRTKIESRSKQRFELDLNVHYRLSTRGAASSRWGTGTVVDMSSSGLSMRCRRPLPVGGHLEMIIDWPATHGGHCPMYLHATGFVVRSGGTKAAMRLTSHRFRLEPVAELSVSAIA
jgi:hypothetical protein